MRKYILVVVFILSAAAARADQLTLRDAAGIMLENNPAFAQKRIQTDIAKEQNSRSKAAYFPQVDFVQGWTRSNNPVFVFGSLLNQQRFSEANFAIDSLNQPDPLNDVTSRFQLGWLLFDSGRRESQVSSAGSMKRIAELTQESSRTNLLQQLVQRYYSVSLARQRLQNAEDNLRSAQSRAEQAAQRVEQGLAVNTESLSAQVFEAQRRQEKIDAENQVRLAQASLNELLGGTASDDLLTAELVEKDFPRNDLSWWLEQMRANRTELKIADEGTRLAGSQYTIARAGFLPSVQAYSAYEWHGKDLSYSGENWTAGVELRWNLFRGFSDSDEVTTARLKQREAEQKRKETDNALALQLQSAFYRFDAATEKLKVASAILGQAAENRRIYGDRYGAGLVSIQDSLQAEAAYSDSHLMYLTNLYELYVAHADLLAAAGLPDRIVEGETK